jgi:hypothetical protein
MERVIRVAIAHDEETARARLRTALAEPDIDVVAEAADMQLQTADQRGLRTVPTSFSPSLLRTQHSKTGSWSAGGHH